MKHVIILCSPASKSVRQTVVRGQKGNFFPPLGLLLVAQTLKNAGYEVKFYDGNLTLDYKRDMLDYISHNHGKILFIGFYLAFLQFRDCIEIIKAAKSIDCGIPIVTGGPFPSAFPNLVMKSGMVDVCCVGDGAKAAEGLAYCLANNKGLHDIPNISFIDDGKIAANPRSHRDDLNEANMIFYENFIDIESYVSKFNIYFPRNYSSSNGRTIPLLTGLGCSYKCAFCENALLGHRHLSLSAENIVEHIIYYHKKFNIGSFYLFDEDFFIDRARLFKFLDLLGKKDLKIEWGTPCRVNYFNENYINRRVIKELEKTGCGKLAMGIESGSPRMLKKIKKGIAPEQALQAAEYGKNSSIYFSYSFIVNFPDETRKELLMTFNLIDRLLSAKKNSFVSAVHYYFAYPATPLSIEAEKRIGFNIEEEFNFEQFGNLSLEEYNKLINPQKKDMYRKCVIYYYHKLEAPFQFRLNIKSIYSDIFRAIGIARKKANFYHLPLEIYLIDWLKSAANKFRIYR